MSSPAETEPWKALLLSSGYTVQDTERIRIWGRLLATLCDETAAPAEGTSQLPDQWGDWIRTTLASMGEDLNDSALVERMEYQLGNTNLTDAALELANQSGLRMEHDTLESADDRSRRLDDQGSRLAQEYLSVLVGEAARVPEFDDGSAERVPSHEAAAGVHHGNTGETAANQPAEEHVAAGVTETRDEIEELVELAKIADDANVLTDAEHRSLVLSNLRQRLA
jgi:hypothetical protein